MSLKFDPKFGLKMNQNFLKVSLHWYINTDSVKAWLEYGLQYLWKPVSVNESFAGM